MSNRTGNFRFLAPKPENPGPVGHNFVSGQTSGRRSKMHERNRIHTRSRTHTHLSTHSGSPKHSYHDAHIDTVQAEKQRNAELCLQLSSSTRAADGKPKKGKAKAKTIKSDALASVTSTGEKTTAAVTELTPPVTSTGEKPTTTATEVTPPVTSTCENASATAMEAMQTLPAGVHNTTTASIPAFPSVPAIVAGEEGTLLPGPPLDPGIVRDQTTKAQDASTVAKNEPTTTSQASTAVAIMESTLQSSTGVDTRKTSASPAQLAVSQGTDVHSTPASADHCKGVADDSSAAPKDPFYYSSSEEENEAEWTTTAAQVGSVCVHRYEQCACAGMNGARTLV